MATPYWQTEEFRKAHGQDAAFGRADVVGAVRAGATLQQISDYLGSDAGKAQIPGGGIVDEMVSDALSGKIRQDWGTFEPGHTDEQKENQRTFIGMADYDIYKAMGKSDLQIQEYVEGRGGNPTFRGDSRAITGSGLGYEIQKSAESTRTSNALADQVAAIEASTAAANKRHDAELARMQKLADERLQLMREQELAAVERAKQVKVRGDTQVGRRTSALGIRQRPSAFAREAARGSLQLARAHKGNQAVTGLNV